MTVKDLIKRLKDCDENQMVLITDGKGWTNIDKLENNGSVAVFLHEETEPIFSD